MATIVFDAKQLAARLRQDTAQSPKAVFNAMVSAAQRGKGFIVGKSPVDRGILRNAWKVVKASQSREVTLTNDQPYAGVMERGARPFKISPEGIEVLTAWVMRKLLKGGIKGKGVGKRGKLTKWFLEDQAKSIAWAIAKTFEKVGIKGRFFVMKNLPQLAELMDSEVQRYLSSFFNRLGSK